MKLLFFISLPVIVIISACSGSNKNNNSTDQLSQEDWENSEELYHQFESFQIELQTPQPGEWLYDHAESGQTLEEYVAGNPVRVTEERNKIYIQLIGDFDSTEHSVILKTKEYLSLFYNVPVILNETSLSLTSIPSGSRRIKYGKEQLHTKYIMYDMLQPNLPDDAIAMIGFTTSDLFPDHRWNFVFGQASGKNRVGIWSINRFGDPNMSPESYMVCLRRTVKTASHEMGHLFSLKHCIHNKCIMNGSNNLEEADAKPTHLCNHCLIKMDWNLQWNHEERFVKLLEFWKEINLADPALYYMAVLQENYNYDSTISP